MSSHRPPRVPDLVLPQSRDYYTTYHGHKAHHLRSIISTLDQVNGLPRVWLAGDSSLDNKYWLLGSPLRIPPNGYQACFQEGGRCVPDVCYHFNKVMEGEACTINTAVEESTLRERLESGLLPQDRILRDHVRSDDVVVVSVGGNDIAHRPTLRTIWNMLLLVYFNRHKTLQNRPKDAWGFQHFITLFGSNVEKYIAELVAKTRPALVIVCMVYFPDMRPEKSWADFPLRILGYNWWPAKLQTIIRQVFEHATRSVRVPGTRVVPFPLFKAMDGTDSSLYRARVEPSDDGGRKIAEAIKATIGEGRVFTQERDRQSGRDGEEEQLLPFCS